MNLRFDHGEALARAKDLLGDGTSLVHRRARLACRDGDAVLLEQLFGLVLVNVHGAECSVGIQFAWSRESND
jgi:hypothetical protein